MKVLLINKFLHQKGGAETYVFRLGACLESRGHQVQYFGMDHPERQLGNRIGAYASYVDYHGSSKLQAVSCIYSRKAAKQLRRVLEDFCPDVCHVNNFHHQLTPSILREIVQWRRKVGKCCPIVYTAHDSQLVCPNHLMRNGSGENCGKCLTGDYRSCIKKRCIHGSLIKSTVGAWEAWFWDRMGIYRYLDTVLAPSRFLARKLEAKQEIRDRITALPNFTEQPGKTKKETGEYVLYFGRYSQEKGLGTLLRAADALPGIPFVFAGEGPMKEDVRKRSNAEDRGFCTGEALEELILGARFTVVPSECYENCPFSILESQSRGTPVLAADIGGIPELVRWGETGELFESGNVDQLIQKIADLWASEERLAGYEYGCKERRLLTAEAYCAKLERIYRGESQ